MGESTELFKKLVSTLKVTNVIPPHLKAICLAQWIVESQYAQSALALNQKNFAGLKWRAELKTLAVPVFVKTPSEPNGEEWCHFENLYDFIKGYWTFLHRSNYPRIEDASRWNDLEFLEYIYSCGYASDPKYLEKVKSKRDEAIIWLGYQPISNKKAESEISVAITPKKPIFKFIPTKKFSSRHGIKIDTIVLHYTVTVNDEHAIFTLTEGARQASCHYLVGKTGDIYQFVDEDYAAWHSPPVNRRSIGIEITAMPGERLQGIQEQKVIELVSYLLNKYSLSYKSITAHKYSPYATACPGNLFADGDASKKNHGIAEFKEWRARNFSLKFPALLNSHDGVVS